MSSNNNQKSKASSGVLTKIMRSEIAILLGVLIALSIVLTFLSPVFFTQHNIVTTLRQISLVAICGFGLTLVILSGEIDLSIGSAQAIAGLIVVYVLNSTGSIALGIAAALSFGIIYGALNGFIVAVGGVNSLIATLGTMAIWRGVAMVTTGAVSIQSAVPEFMDVGTGFIGPFPNALLIAVALYVILYYVLHMTTFGRYIYCVGGNKEAARLAGLPVVRIKMMVYIICGVCAMLSGVLLASRMASAQPTAGTGFELVVIASVILGGISLAGGIGSITGALLGMMILGVLQNGLTLLDVSSFWQDIIRGCLIIMAVFLDGRRKENLAKQLIREQKKHNESEQVKS